MEGSSSKPSSSPSILNLLCREDTSCLNEADELNLGTQFLNSQIVPYFQDLVSEDDDVYLQMLVQRERDSSSNSPASSSDYPSWLKNYRSLAINWILNVRLLSSPTPLFNNPSN